ncbi:phage minor head protein [Aestuariivirga sp. YIM B02566]|uniref:Uncharacterized protein n=1 Tax=Taklimakanibacter albus TaxID=2800327 RepID=A0ACC5R6H1_9HYPH|nr:phage minor head protein [Aestuariivirga sp. YIM B02566]MBK1868264.1 hypothetical protein [Aestuariivirga sp. YIM B02566]
MKATIKISSEPSPEVMRFFEEKSLRPSFNWRDVWGEEHAHAFTVAKSAGFDILTDVRGAVADALREGKTFETFQAELEPILRGKGWWGKKKLIDPKTGELVDAQLGSARRLRVIYEANVRSARAAGQWERAQRTKAALPYFEYRLGPSERHRPHHVEKAGIILPIDDPFWDEWFPPNGWGCKCWLRQISRSAASAAGGVSARPIVPRRRYENTRRGIVEELPVGIDPGWQTSPGKGRARFLSNEFLRRVDGADEPAARESIREFWGLPMSAVIGTMEERVPLPVGASRKLQAITGARGASVAMWNDKWRAARKKHGHAQEMADALMALDQVIEAGEEDPLLDRRPGEVWLYPAIFGRVWKVVIVKSEAGYMRLKSFMPYSPARAEKDRK